VSRARAQPAAPRASALPRLRLQSRNDAPVREDGRFVLYWMNSAHRTRFNFALERAAEWALRLQRPLVVLELLRCGYPHASDRIHRFLLEGMAANARRLAGKPVLHYPYLEPAPGRAEGLLEALGAQACVAITDVFPAFFLPGWVEEIAARFPVRLEEVDSNGLLPLRAADEPFATAHSFRHFLQRMLPPHLGDFPREEPLRGARLPAPRPLPAAVTRRWPPATERALWGAPEVLARLPIDHSVPPVEHHGGSEEGRAALRLFARKRLARYAEERNHPDLDATSGLSPYLHFGHVSAHEVFSVVAAAEGWDSGKLSTKAGGGRSGWWGMGESAEAFLDQLVTWRELGFQTCARREDYYTAESLPAWALRTLEEHAADRRPRLYSREELEGARTHDPLWNAAQRQLLREGRIHNYLRMLWGKKVLEWSPSFREALDTMIALNDRHALDGRDPNSYSGILWCLGKYDRPWGPERPVFGTVRYMTSHSAARKLRVREYLRRYGS